jgi:hypothetical protein
VQGLSSDEVCAVLDISSANQRVLLHRGRSPDCPEYLAQIRAVIPLAGSITPDDLTPSMRGEFTSLYRRWLADEARDHL